MLPKNQRFDTIIVGAGLAGACAAVYLSQHHHVLVIEAQHPASGASSAAAGLVNPLMSQKAKPVWRMDAALDALRETLAMANAADLLSRDGVLRPATSTKQARVFQDVATAQPNDAMWLSEAAVHEQFSPAAAPYGALLVRQGGALSVPAFVNAMLGKAQQQNARLATGARVIGWQENSDGVHLDVVSDATTTRLHANRVVLALGYGYRFHPALRALNLHPIKGQTIRVPASGDRLPLPLAGRGYIVPEGDTLIVGSTYEHHFTTLQPSDEQTRLILKKAVAMLPSLRTTTVLEATAGVRVTVPGTRLPMLGPLPQHNRVWMFSGLGSKGVLMAPLLARHLASYLEKPETLPPEIQVSLAK